MQARRVEFDHLLDDYRATSQAEIRAAEPAEWGKRLLRLGALTSAAAAASGMAVTAEAGILYSGIQELQTPRGGPGCGFSTCQVTDLIRFDLDGDQANDKRIVNWYGGSDGTVYTYHAYLGGGVAGVVVDGRRWVRKFASGSLIGASGSWASSADLLSYWPYYQPYSFAQGETAIAGVREGDNFGWVRIRIDPGQPGVGYSANEFAVVDWAFETEPGVPIAAGAVPEPDPSLVMGLALLCLGARGVRESRKRARS